MINKLSVLAFTIVFLVIAILLVQFSGMGAVEDRTNLFINAFFLIFVFCAFIGMACVAALVYFRKKAARPNMRIIYGGKYRSKKGG